MFILLVYDIDFSNDNGAKRLNKVSKLCQKFGIRVQNSVFEMNIDSKDLLKLKNDIKKIINEQDSIRIYKLGKIENIDIEIIGNKEKVEITNNENFIF